MVSIFKRRDFYAICGFFAISPFLTWLNKYILNNGSDIFQLVFFQQFMSFLIYSLNISQKWKFHHLKICALPAVFLTLQLVLSNVCLKGTSLPLYQVTRATSLFFSITTVERCRASQIAGATGVGLGFIIAALDKAQYISDLKRTWTAILAGIGASAAGVAFMSYSRRTSIELGSSTLFVRLLTLNTAMFLVPVMAFTSQKANFFTFNLYTEIALYAQQLHCSLCLLCHVQFWVLLKAQFKLPLEQFCLDPLYLFKLPLVHYSVYWAPPSIIRFNQETHMCYHLP